MNGLFGGKSKMPKMIQQPTRVEQDSSAQEELQRQAVMKRYAKLRRATILNENWKPDKRKTLGAA